MKKSTFVVLAIALLAIAGCGAAAPKPSEPMPDPLAGVPARVLYNRGLRHAKQGDDVRAEQYLTAALEHGAPAEKVLPALVEAAISGQRYRSALGYAEALIARGNADWTIHYLVATLRAGTGNEAGAKRILVQLLEDQPAAAAPRYLYAALLIAEGGRGREARHNLEEYLELAPEGDHAAEARRLLRHGDLR